MTKLIEDAQKVLNSMLVAERAQRTLVAEKELAVSKVQDLQIACANGDRELNKMCVSAKDLWDEAWRNHADTLWTEAWQSMVKASKLEIDEK